MSAPVAIVRSVTEPDPVLPSLDLVLDVVRASREERRGHFDALDTKAGVVLGFAGVLVTLSPSIHGASRHVGASLAGCSAMLALVAAWPRSFDLLQHFRAYVAERPEASKLVLVDVLDFMEGRTDKIIKLKGWFLRFSLLLMAAAVAVMAAGAATMK